MTNANTWWRNQQTAGGAFSISDMNTMYNDCGDGVDPPNFLLSGQTVFEYYENSQVGQIRYADSRMADAGFDNMLYKQKPWIYDDNIGTTDALYFLNSKYLYLCLKTGADFRTTDFIEPDNQAAKVAKILLMGQLVSDNRRRLGVLTAITAPA